MQNDLEKLRKTGSRTERLLIRVGDKHDAVATAIDRLAARQDEAIDQLVRLHDDADRLAALLIGVREAIEWQQVGRPQEQGRPEDEPRKALGWFGQIFSRRD